MRSFLLNAGSRVPLGRLLLACVSSIASWCWAGLAGAVGPAKLSKGPYLTGLSDTGVDVRFELDGTASADVTVVAASNGAAQRVFADGAPAAMHVVHATGLSPGSAYAYTVRVDGKAAGQGRFSTAPVQGPGARLKFLVYGDDRSDPTAHAAVVRALMASPSDFLVNTGDMVEDGGRAEDWQSFFDVEAALLRDRAIFVAVGNHELYDDRAGANFARYFGFIAPNGRVKPYGTFRLGNVRFFFLNSLHEWGSGEERQWLESQLSHSDDEAGLVWRIAVMHHGPWSSGPHGANAELASAHVPELLAAHGVDLVLAGHDHIYERGATGGMKYVTSGGGGAPLYRSSKTPFTRRSESTYHFVEVTAGDHEIQLLARRIDGSVLDRCGFAKGRAWDCDAPDIQGSVSPDSGVRGAGAASAPVAPSPPLAADSPSSRCACEMPGRRAGSTTVGLLLAGLMGFALMVRRGEG